MVACIRDIWPVLLNEQEKGFKYHTDTNNDNDTQSCKVFRILLNNIFTNELTLFVLEFPWIIYMGHLLSKNGYRLKKRTRKLHHRKKKKRNCFLQLPCMLCFIVHSNSSGLDDSDHLEAGVNGSVCRHNSITGISVPGVGGVGIGAAAASKLAERYATLASPEDCSKFLLSPRELAIWEGQGRSLLSAVPAKLIPPPALFRTAGVSVTLPIPVPVPVPGCTSDYTEMVGSCGGAAPTVPTVVA